MTLRNPITEPQIPGAIARDSEVTAAIAAHEVAIDPHPTYLTEDEGNILYLGVEDASKNSLNLMGLLTPRDNPWTPQWNLGTLSGSSDTNENAVFVYAADVAEYAQQISPVAISQVVKRFVAVLHLPVMGPGFKQSYFITFPSNIFPSIESAYQAFFIDNVIPNGEMNIRIQPVFSPGGQIVVWIENLSGFTIPATANARIKVLIFD